MKMGVQFIRHTFSHTTSWLEHWENIFLRPEEALTEFRRKLVFLTNLVLLLRKSTDIIDKYCLIDSEKK